MEDNVVSLMSLSSRAVGYLACVEEPRKQRFILLPIKGDLSGRYISGVGSIILPNRNAELKLLLWLMVIPFKYFVAMYIY